MANFPLLPGSSEIDGLEYDCSLVAAFPRENEHHHGEEIALPEVVYQIDVDVLLLNYEVRKAQAFGRALKRTDVPIVPGVTIRVPIGADCWWTFLLRCTFPCSTLPFASSCLLGLHGLYRLVVTKSHI